MKSIETEGGLVVATGWEGREWGGLGDWQGLQGLLRVMKML